MLPQNGRLAFGANTTTFCLDGPALSSHEWMQKNIGGMGKLASIPRGYGANGLQPALTAGSMSSRIGPSLTFSGMSPINQGISVTASGQIITFSGIAPLAALVNMLASGSIITFSGSAGIYGVASMNATGGITFSGMADIGGLYSIGASGSLIFSGSATTHSLAHLVTTEQTGTMTEATITAAVWASVEGSSVVKLLGNKVVRLGDVITIYENDGLTIWRQFDLANGGRVLV